MLPANPNYVHHKHRVHTKSCCRQHKCFLCLLVLILLASIMMIIIMGRRTEEGLPKIDDRPELLPLHALDHENNLHHRIIHMKYHEDLQPNSDPPTYRDIISTSNHPSVISDHKMTDDLKKYQGHSVYLLYEKREKEEEYLLSSGYLPSSGTIFGFHDHVEMRHVHRQSKIVLEEELQHHLELMVFEHFPENGVSWNVNPGIVPQHLVYTSQDDQEYHFDFSSSKTMNGDDRYNELNTRIAHVIQMKTWQWTKVYTQVQRDKIEPTNDDLIWYLQPFVENFGKYKIGALEFKNEVGIDWFSLQQDGINLMVDSVSKKLTDGNGIIRPEFAQDPKAMNTFATIIAQCLVSHHQDRTTNGRIGQQGHVHVTCELSEQHIHPLYLSMALLDEKYINDLYTRSNLEDPFKEPLIDKIWNPDVQISEIQPHFGEHVASMTDSEDHKERKRIYSERVKTFANFMRSRFREIGITFVSALGVENYAKALYGARDVDIDTLMVYIEHNCKWLVHQSGNTFAYASGHLKVKYNNYVKGYLEKCRHDGEDGKMRVRKLLKFWTNKEFSIPEESSIRLFREGTGEYEYVHRVIDKDDPQRSQRQWAETHRPIGHTCLSALDIYIVNETQEEFNRKLEEATINSDGGGYSVM